MPALSHTLADHVHRAAHIFAAIVPVPVSHRQRSLSKLGGHAQKSADPHPEDGSRPADGHRSGNPGKIAGTHRSRQRRTHRLERRDRAVSAFTATQLMKESAQRFRQQPQLHKAGAQRQPKSHRQDSDQCRRAPDQRVDPFQYRRHFILLSYHRFHQCARIFLPLSQKIQEKAVLLSKNCFCIIPILPKFPGSSLLLPACRCAPPESSSAQARRRPCLPWLWHRPCISSGLP